MWGVKQGIPDSCSEKRKSGSQGVHDFGIQMAWGQSMVFPKPKEGGGGKVFTLPMVGYGYFLESPNLKQKSILNNVHTKQEYESFSL